MSDEIIENLHRLHAELSQAATVEQALLFANAISQVEKFTRYATKEESSIGSEYQRIPANRPSPSPIIPSQVQRSFSLNQPSQVVPRTQRIPPNRPPPPSPIIPSQVQRTPPNRPPLPPPIIPSQVQRSSSLNETSPKSASQAQRTPPNRPPLPPPIIPSQLQRSSSLNKTSPKSASQAQRTPPNGLRAAPRTDRIPPPREIPPQFDSSIPQMRTSTRPPPMKPPRPSVNRSSTINDSSVSLSKPWMPSGSNMDDRSISVVETSSSSNSSKVSQSIHASTNSNHIAGKVSARNSAIHSEALSNVRLILRKLESVTYGPEGTRIVYYIAGYTNAIKSMMDSTDPDSVNISEIIMPKNPLPNLDSKYELLKDTTIKILHEVETYLEKMIRDVTEGRLGSQMCNFLDKICRRINTILVDFSANV